MSRVTDPVFDAAQTGVVGGLNKWCEWTTQSKNAKRLAELKRSPLMAVIRRNLQHELGASEARARVEALAKKLESHLDADYCWEGSTLQFTRSGASGRIDVGDEKLEIEVKLGALLSPLKGMIEKTLDDAIEKQLTA